MIRSRSSIQRRRVACPECGREFTISWRTGVKRFRARTHGCPNCDFVGRAGMFDDPMEDLRP